MSTLTGEDTLGGLGSQSKAWGPANTNHRDAQKQEAEAMQTSLNRFTTKVSRQYAKAKQ
jgi:hypothetical protein